MNRQILSICGALALLSASPVHATQLTGGEIVLTPLLDFEKFGIHVDTFGNTTVDSQGRIRFQVTGGDIDTNDLSTATVDFADGDGFSFTRDHTVGSGALEQTLTGVIDLRNFSIDATAIEDLGLDFGGSDLGQSTGSVINDATLINIAVDATKTNGLDATDPTLSEAEKRRGRVIVIDDLTPEQQNAFLNGSQADGSAQADGKFITTTQFLDNETFGLAVRDDPLNTSNDMGLGALDFALFQDALASPLFVELLPFYHTAINAQSTLGFDAAERAASGFVDNAALFRVHGENLQFGSVPAPGGLLLILSALGLAALRRRA